MPKKSVKLKGICSDFKNLTGVGFTFFPISDSRLPRLCEGGKACPLKGPAEQRKTCQGKKERLITQSVHNDDVLACTSPCGMTEFLLPVFSDGELQGLILSEKIYSKRKQARKKTEPPHFSPQEFSSLIVILNSSSSRLRKSIPSELISSKQKQDQNFIGKARRYIHKNYHNFGLTLKELSREVGTNYYHLSRLFKEETGLNFVQYLTLTRLKIALQLLKNDHLTVAQVAYAVGYNDPQYFDRIFKKYLDLRPSDYRKTADSKKDKLREKVLNQFSHFK